MAKIRIGLGSDFRLNDQKLGLGENNPQERLDVAGVAKGKDLKVTGIASFTAYEGFLRADHQIAENTTLSFDQGPSASLSGEIIVGTGATVTIQGVGLGTTTVGNGSGTIENTIDTTDATRAGGSEIECLKVFNTFTPPSGGTNERPYAPKPGELYYNYDFKTIEFFDGNGWRQVDNTTRSGRGFFMAGYNPTNLKNIDTVNIQSFGNAVNFGDLLSAGYLSSCNSSSTRGVHGGIYPAPSPTSQYEYFTLASSGNSIYFGDLHVNGTYGKGAASSSTRGLRGGYYNAANAIEYITMTTLGDGLDFGDLSEGRAYPVGMSNGTRGVYAGGFFGDGRQVSRSTIDYVIIASKGNAVRFGDLTRHIIPNDSAVSNSTRGIVGSGPQYTGPSAFNYQQKTSDYITLASEGNAITFGELLSLGGAGANTETRGLFGGGYLTPSAKTNIIQYVTMSSTGNALDFGDLAKISAYNAGCSDSHGGLGGF